MATFRITLEDGSGFLLLEDGSSYLLLEDAVAAAPVHGLAVGAVVALAWVAGDIVDGDFAVAGHTEAAAAVAGAIEPYAAAGAVEPYSAAGAVD